MSIKIKHPEGATGTFSGIDFEDGEAEIASISDEARAVLTDHGYTFDGESEPVEIVGTPADEAVTLDNAAAVEHPDGTVEVGTISEPAAEKPKAPAKKAKPAAK